MVFKSVGNIFGKGEKYCLPPFSTFPKMSLKAVYFWAIGMELSRVFGKLKKKKKKLLISSNFVVFKNHKIPKKNFFF